jgi:hypothetical protein
VANVSYNLATLSDAERLAVYADLSACLIRWKVRDLTGKDRQRVARELLQKHSAEMQPLIQEALTRRANGSVKQKPV